MEGLNVSVRYFGVSWRKARRSRAVDFARRVVRGAKKVAKFAKEATEEPRWGVDIVVRDCGVWCWRLLNA